MIAALSPEKVTLDGELHAATLTRPLYRPLRAICRSLIH